jgi:hypothetical protein
MFENFRHNFIEDSEGSPRAAMSFRTSDPILKYFFGVLGGKSFNGGLYRTVHVADMRLWVERIHFAFPTFSPPAVCFGYDWMGRAFALESGRSEDGLPGVLMFDVGGGDAFEIPANLITFHDSEIIKSAEPALAINLYETWRAPGGAAPAYDKCIGLRVPLFLGGEEDVGNLEAGDLDVYWTIFGQALRQVGPGEEEE